MSVVLRKKREEKIHFFVSCPRGLESLLIKEVRSLAPDCECREGVGGIHAQGTLDLGYQLCLDSRVASRVLMEVAKFERTRNDMELYQAAKVFDWTRLFNLSATFAIYFTHAPSDRIDDQYWALKLKDAIADQFRSKFAERPDVNRQEPDVTFRAHLEKGATTVYLDFSGGALHERGYRRETGLAPMKENLAAGLLGLVDPAGTVMPRSSFYDPFCGSGTLVIEAALKRLGVAPGLSRIQFGFEAWRGHIADLYLKLRNQRELFLESLKPLPEKFWGTDVDPQQVERAKANAHSAGIAHHVHFEVADALKSKAPFKGGVIVTNPPYGERLGDSQDLTQLYKDLGHHLKNHFGGYTVGLISSDKNLLKMIPLKPMAQHRVFNGKLESQFLVFYINK